MVDHTQNQSSDGNSFVTGFTIGLFTGAAGYYLFATERGAKLRQQLVTEWENAKIDLVEEGVIENQHVSLREFLFDLLHKAFTPEGSKPRTYQQVALTEELEAGRKKAREVSSRLKKDSSKRFKGV